MAPLLPRPAATRTPSNCGVYYLLLVVPSLGQYTRDKQHDELASERYHARAGLVCTSLWTSTYLLVDMGAASCSAHTRRRRWRRMGETPRRRTHQVSGGCHMMIAAFLEPSRAEQVRPGGAVSCSGAGGGREGSGALGLPLWARRLPGCCELRTRRRWRTPC